MKECENDVQMSEVSARAAKAILQPYVEHIFAKFADFGLDLDVTVKVTPKARDNGRHFAACSVDGDLILLAPEMVMLPEDTVCGIIAHEAGHACDFRHPAMWARDRHGKAVLLDVSSRGSRRDDAFPAEWIRDWAERSDDEVERMADAIAETVLGKRVGYRDACVAGRRIPMLQTLQGGRPRPRGLR